MAAQLPEEDTGTLIIVQSFRPARFFGVAQQRRLTELMARWRAARDAGTTLPAPEQTELDALIGEEIRASVQRTAALLHELGR